MGRRTGLVVLGVALLALPMSASAGSPWMDEATYSEQALAKLKYGLTNGLLGWTSLFRTPAAEIQAGENVVVGIGKGLWNATGQTVGGALHAATFPITAIDIPLPEGGTDLLQ
mgnify:CR=1 FL=1